MEEEEEEEEEEVITSGNIVCSNAGVFANSFLADAPARNEFISCECSSKK